MTTTTKDRKVLGRGFASLLPGRPQASNASEQAKGLVTMVATSKVHANSNQPRKHFSLEAIEELARSIREKGLLQPLLVQPLAQVEGDYLLIAGERRLRACKLAGLQEVPVIVKRVDARERFELALIENLQREDLNPMEEANSYQRLIQEYALSQEDIAKHVGKSRSAIANTLRLLKLPDKVKRYLAEGRLKPGQVRPLISIKDPKKVLRLAEEIIGQGLSARDVEATSGKKGTARQKSRQVTPKVNHQNPHVAAIEARLRRRLGTKVEVSEKEGQGSIAIRFFSLEDLGRILNILEAKGA